ncbi:hypothetical protein [Glycomyces buryatensis]|uniref:Tetratricopeptide repeat protein n=1 Tax=Glycomyces buryatensis TaxID=2570927 RepID=A0A4S8Q6M1_9ACTN|nr:hypothetical protein [Glycomyces buryatensis]THV39838.1 hypothetical protein FAB82_16650 [Glycomyces buryatensis]
MFHRIALKRARNAGIRAAKALTENDLGIAEDEFNKALKQTAKRIGRDPAVDAIASAARIGLGRVCLARAEPQAADRWFGETQQLWPADWGGYYWAGCAAAHGDQFARAEWYFAAAIARGAPNGRAHIQRAYVHAKLGHDSQALADLYAAAQQWPLTVAARELAAVLALRQGQLPQADWYASALTTPIGAAVRGAIAHRDGDARAVLAEHGKAIDGGLGDAAVLLQHGAAAYRLGDFDRGAESWSRVRGHEHLAASARYARALERLGDRDFGGALPDLEAAAGQGIEAPLEAARLHAAAAAIADGDTEAARLHLKAGAGERGAVLLGLLDFNEGEMEAAIEAWRGSANHPVVRLGLALLELRAGEDAEAELESLFDFELPEAIWRTALRARGALLARGGDWAGARDAFDASNSGVVRDTVATDDTFGECLYRTGNFDQLRHYPENPWYAAGVLRLDRDAEVPLGTGRAAREAAFVLRQAAYDAAAEGDWDRAAKLLGRSDAACEPTAATLVIDAVTSALGGRRQDALARLDARGRPSGARLAHTRALILLHGAGHGESSGLAERCIAAWAPLLDDDGFWQKWVRSAETRYGRSVPAAALADMRGRLRRLIEDAAARGGAKDAADLLRRESDATALLSELGGLPIGGGVRISCGPMRIAELGLHRRLSEFVLDNEFATSGDPLLQFSAAGLVLARLNADQPAEALKLALDTRCPDCRGRRGGRARGGGDEPLICDLDCAEFDNRNPAFATLPDKHSELSELAAALASSALLDLAKAAIAKQPMDIADAKQRWRHAIAHADRNGERYSAIEPMTETALGRAETLSRRRKLDEPINLLEAVLPLLSSRDEPQRERVITRLSDLLGQRGVGKANDGKERSARKDLERAVELAPHQIGPRRNLGVVLQNTAAKRLNLDSTVRPSESALWEAVGLLDQSAEQFRAGLRIQPRHPEVTELLAESEKLHVLISTVLGGGRPRRGW